MSAIIIVRRLAMMGMAILLMVGAVAGMQVATALPAHAICVAQPLVGNWRNINPATNAMTRININFNCGDTVLCDTNGNCTGGQSYFTLRPYGKCHPTDCDWGVRRAENMYDGWKRAIYNFGFKTSYVWVKTYVISGTTRVRLWIYNDFPPTDGRKDYTTDEWMVK